MSSTLQATARWRVDQDFAGSGGGGGGLLPEAAVDDEAADAKGDGACRAEENKGDADCARESLGKGDEM